MVEHLVANENVARSNRVTRLPVLKQKIKPSRNKLPRPPKSQKDKGWKVKTPVMITLKKTVAVVSTLRKTGYLFLVSFYAGSVGWFSRLAHPALVEIVENAI